MKNTCSRVKREQETKQKMQSALGRTSKGNTYREKEKKATRGKREKEIEERETFGYGVEG